MSDPTTPCPSCGWVFGEHAVDCATRTDAAPVVLDLQAIEERAGGATPGPWSVHAQHVVFDHDGGYLRVFAVANWGTQADAEFTAYAREDVPALVAEVRRLQALVLEYDADPQPLPAGIEPGMLVTAISRPGSRASHRKIIGTVDTIGRDRSNVWLRVTETVAPYRVGDTVYLYAALYEFEVVR